MIDISSDAGDCLEKVGILLFKVIQIFLLKQLFHLSTKNEHAV